MFDAHYRDTPSVKEIITKNLSVHYTDFGQTADTYIEKSCASLRYELRSVKGKGRMIVATSDERRHKSRKQNSSRFLASSLDPESQQRLAKLRMGLH